MQVVNAVDNVRQARRADPALSWGLVPTMGALHEGHLSLVRRARAENERVGVSIFVNPTQFAPTEDLNRYPRPRERDLDLLKQEGADLVWTPEPGHVYADGFQTTVTVAEVAKPLEGAARPGHFEGVATVVAKLFNVFEPARAYFGQKDAQQVAVLKRMVADLNFNLEIVVCPIVREPDGLALSSRNAYLDSQEREAATALFRSLMAAQEVWDGGERDGETLREIMLGVLEGEPLARVDYVSAADPETLAEIEGEAERALLSMAVYVGETRLIDNIVLNAGADHAAGD